MRLVPLFNHCFVNTQESPSCIKELPDFINIVPFLSIVIDLFHLSITVIILIPNTLTSD